VFHIWLIDLFLSDVIMPEINGRDLVVRLKAAYTGMGSLFMSGYPADAIAQHGVLEENIQLFQKPFSMNEIAAKIREALH
jgi:DNA-binding NtrC family response regulator